VSAKQAKRLRKAAMGLAVSVSEAGREIRGRTLLAQEHRRTAASSTVTSSASMKPDQIVSDDVHIETFAVSAINAPNSLRGIIRSLKKGMKNGTLDKMPPRSRCSTSSELR